MENSKRAVGLDILKTVAAIMIIVLHYNGYSGNLMPSTVSNYGLFVISNLMESFCICGVNVFVIISSYLSIKAMKTNVESGIKRTVSVWVQTIIVTIPLAVLLLLTGIAKFSVKDILFSVFPFSTRAYWFITTFMCFSLLLPLLNRSVKVLLISSLLYVSCVLVAVFCVIPTFFELFGWNDVQHGYSLAWFVTLYYCTAFCMKSQWYKKIPAWIYGVGYVVCSLCLWGSVLVIGSIGPLSGYANYFIRNYASVPIFIQSFLLVFVFLRLDFKGFGKKQVFSILASGSLMSYILHMHPLLKQFYTRIYIGTYYAKDALTYIIICIVISMLVFLMGVLMYHALKKPITLITGYTIEQVKQIMVSLHKFSCINRKEHTK